VAKKMIGAIASVALMVLIISLLWVWRTASPAGADQKPKDEAKSFSGRSILIDAGHGGFDIGASGVNGSNEAVLNLAVAKALKAELESRGAVCVMTRSDDGALGATKDEDMQNRAAFIYQNDGDALISIHMNSFPQDSTVSGPQVFYQQGSKQGAALAAAIQARMNEDLGGRRSSTAGDLMVLRSGNAPAVLVECGFISNPDEEKNLQDPAYQKKLAAAVADGMEAYFK
jgi:N-acetylmuramoyl-L-alanine amidase